MPPPTSPASLGFHETQVFSFPTNDPGAFELPDSGTLQLMFASNRPLRPPAWDEEHLQAVFQKAKHRYHCARVLYLLVLIFAAIVVPLSTRPFS